MIVDSMDVADLYKLYIEDKDTIVKRKIEDSIHKVYRIVCKTNSHILSYFKPIEFKSKNGLNWVIQFFNFGADYPVMEDARYNGHPFLLDIHDFQIESGQ